MLLYCRTLWYCRLLFDAPALGARVLLLSRLQLPRPLPYCCNLILQHGDMAAVLLYPSVRKALCSTTALYGSTAVDRVAPECMTLHRPLGACATHTLRCARPAGAARAARQVQMMRCGSWQLQGCVTAGLRGVLHAVLLIAASTGSHFAHRCVPPLECSCLG